MLVRYGHALSEHEQYIEALLTFGVCHLFGNNPSCPSHDSVVNKTAIILNCLKFFILGLIPLTSLTYAIKYSDAKNLGKCFRLGKKVETSQVNISSGEQRNNSVLNSPAAAAT